MRRRRVAPPVCSAPVSRVRMRAFEKFAAATRLSSSAVLRVGASLRPGDSWFLRCLVLRSVFHPGASISSPAWMRTDSRRALRLKPARHRGNGAGSYEVEGDSFVTIVPAARSRNRARTTGDSCHRTPYSYKQRRNVQLAWTARFKSRSTKGIVRRRHYWSICGANAAAVSRGWRFSTKPPTWWTRS